MMSRPRPGADFFRADKLAGSLGFDDDCPERVEAAALHEGRKVDIMLELAGLSAQEREILLAGCLMNWYKEKRHD